MSISDDGQVRYLHLGSIWVQGSMRTSQPFDIDLDYVQRMMAWLMFVPELSEGSQIQAAKAIAGKRVMQLGLGAAALTKFCWKRLKTETCAVELNPAVLAACRHHFKLPFEAERLRVILADAGKEIANTAHLGAWDALQVDLYDHDAAAPVLDSAAFYSHCRRALVDGGLMAVNLFGRRTSFAQSMSRIETAFGVGRVWAFAPTREGNVVVLAQRAAARSHAWPDRDILVERAARIESLWKLPARKWLRISKPWEAPAV